MEYDSTMNDAGPVENDLPYSLPLPPSGLRMKIVEVLPVYKTGIGRASPMDIDQTIPSMRFVPARRDELPNRQSTSAKIQRGSAPVQSDSTSDPTI